MSPSVQNSVTPHPGHKPGPSVTRVPLPGRHRTPSPIAFTAASLSSLSRVPPMPGLSVLAAVPPLETSFPSCPQG